ncbi:hypothetical protein A3C18_03305 [Candidatus Kaiserbacteria bacterium RIFCSPHIGHO2_02_FULL_54_11b]|uniref:Uncharacterized protein n=2 Tax=Candidatus Kaiseribacteriota TaxID=1752734 RepID=A0A1F6CQT8_9BACT|nr:MAG: hypothetical protein A2704_02175 [Candidatus Kaiserbacteria bacterium RIFCSPHIGHO2_01_FULL_54_36b]OGG64498.1 MAG: hypothetical protein A3C18_03305 [Candidatus Kaiserbacteria bacterium RIFCSPHIGHO2_02_FULL_54_11b]
MTDHDAIAAADLKTSYNRDELIACGEKRLREGLPPLPRGEMLMFDRITNISISGGDHGKGFVRATLDVKRYLWFFPLHFKDDPVMPGCLGLDALWQLTGFFIGHCGANGKGRALEVGNVKFAGEVLPTAKLVTYRVEIKKLLKGGGRRPWIAFGDGYVYCDGEEIYTAEGLKVGVFPKS